MSENENELDQVMLGILKRSMDQMFEQLIDHARSKGAEEDWLNRIRQLDQRVAWGILELFYGAPDNWPK